MKTKLLLIISFIAFAIAVKGQTTTMPSGYVTSSPQFGRVNATDSIYLKNPATGKFYTLATWLQSLNTFATKSPSGAYVQLTPSTAQTGNINISGQIKADNRIILNGDSGNVTIGKGDITLGTMTGGGSISPTGINFGSSLGGFSLNNTNFYSISNDLSHSLQSSSSGFSWRNYGSGVNIDVDQIIGYKSSSPNFYRISSDGLSFTKNTNSRQILVDDSSPITSSTNFWPNRDGFLAVENGTVAVVETIADLQAYNGTATSVNVKHALRGGIFNLKTGLTADGGTIFEATGLGSGYYWQRDITNAEGYHVNWFGAVSYDRNNYVIGDFDSRAAFQACINARPTRNTPVILGLGVYMLSGPLVMGQGTLFKGKSTLWPRQYFGDGSLFIDYKNMTAVRYYNTFLNGFTTTTDVVNYRSQGIAFKDIGIFGPGREYNTVGVALYRTENSTSPAKTTGLVTMENVYFADWGVGADGTNSTDTWYLTRVHFADVKIGLIGGSGQTFAHHTDFFKIDSIGAISNSPNDPDVFTDCEFETRYSSNGALVVNGRVIAHGNQFLTNKKSIVFNSTANRSIISNSTFIANSDTDISLSSGTVGISLNNLTFDKNYVNNAGFNYNFVPEPANYSANSIYATGSDLKVSDITFIKSQALFTGAPMLIDNCTIMSSDNKYRGYSFGGNDENIVFTGTNVKFEAYDIAGRKINGPILPGTDQSFNIGSASLQFNSVYASRLAAKSGTALTLGTEGSNTLNFMTNGVNRVRFDGSGNFTPLADNAYLLGGTGATWSNIFTTNLRLSLSGLLVGSGSGSNVRAATASDITSLTVVIDATTTAYTSSTLNSTYPNVAVGVTVYCRNITGGGLAYTKQTEAGSSDVWVSAAITIVP